MRDDKNKLSVLLTAIATAMIDPAHPNSMPEELRSRMDSIRDLIPIDIMNDALQQKFDAKDYLASSPTKLVLRAITEAVNADEARKIAGKTKAEIVKFAIANVVKTGWLPPELRTSHYKQPSTKKKK